MTSGARLAVPADGSLDPGLLCPLPSTDAWRAAAEYHDELFAPLEHGARIALLPRTAPSFMLVWEIGDSSVDARIEPFMSYAATRADIVLASDDVYLAKIRAASEGAVFVELRAGIRSGHIVCYVLKRRCVLEERGFDELLEALGFAFMGACR